MYSRRQWLQRGSMLAGGALLSLRSGRAVDRSPATPSGLVAGKSNDLTVLAADPIVLETPVPLLAKAVTTPDELLFVRNNANPPGMATLAPPEAAEWTLELQGLAEGPRSIGLPALGALPQHEVEMVLQCSGNGRSMFSRAAKISGTPWGRGGIGNVRFGGARLADALAHLRAAPIDGARYVAAEGFDAPRGAEEDFEHSLPLDDALATSILATTMNGRPLPAVHGGPLRLITPGYFGTVQLKWLTRLRFEPLESANEHHAVRYRTPDRLLRPGEAFDFNRANSTPTWRMNVASLITSHADGQTIPPGQVSFSGYAWNDGFARLSAVLYSVDQGSTWRQAGLARSKSPYAWSRWTTTFPAAPGRLILWVRAIDALGRSQPLDGQIAWNPGGYAWNGVEKIGLEVG